MRIACLMFAVFLGWSAQALAVEEARYFSEIPDIQLWYLERLPSGGYSDRGTANHDRDSANDNIELFRRHCRKHGVLYVGASGDPLKCRLIAAPAGSPDDSFNGAIGIEAGQRKLGGWALVSLRPLTPRVKTSEPDAEESRLLAAAMRKVAPAMRREAQKLYGTDHMKNYAAAVKDLEKDAKYRKYAGARYKVPTTNGFLYILPGAVTVSELGWDLELVVFRRNGDEMKKLGYLTGCIEEFRDLDADGVPEVLTTLCENEEGNETEYSTLKAPFHSVVQWSQ